MFEHSRLRAICGMAALTFSLTVAGSTVMVTAQQQPAPDNTKTNARDRQAGQPTADDQSNRKPDLEITQNIRKAVMEDTSLSTYAHNVKIITKGGKVTLKGPVRSEEEKSTIATKAAQIVGKSNVMNRLTITPAKDQPAKSSK
jgi:hyperosmotically inducible protein